MAFSKTGDDSFIFSKRSGWKLYFVVSALTLTTIGFQNCAESLHTIEQPSLSDPLGPEPVIVPQETNGIPSPVPPPSNDSTGGDSPNDPEVTSIIPDSLTWQRVAKRTLAQKSAGLSGGEGWQMIFGISYAPSNPNVVYFVTDTNQVWKSLDGGKSWNRKANGFLANGGISLAVDPNNPNIVFVAGSLNMGGLPSGEDSMNPVQGIIQSTNGGESWKLVTSYSYSTLAPQARFHRSAQGGVHFAFAGSAIYAAPSTGGLLKSTNGGTVWNRVLQSGGGNVLDTLELRNITVHPTKSTVLFVSAADGLYKVIDNGSSATVTKLITGLPAGGAYQVQINKSNPLIMYVAMGTKGIYGSTDGGVSFSARNNGLLAPLTNGGRIKYLAMSPANPKRLMVTIDYLWGNGLFYTHDGGTNWAQTLSMDEKNADGWVAGSTFGYDFGSGVDGANSPIAFHPTDDDIAIAVGWGNQVKKTEDGGLNWKYSNSGYVGATTAQFGTRPIGWDSTNPKRATFFHSDFGALITADGESTFKSIATAAWNGRHAALCGAMRGNIILSAIGPYTSQRIHVSRDSGATWTAAAGADDNYHFIEFHPQNSNVVYAGKHKFTSIQSNNAFTTLTEFVSGVFKGNGNVVYARRGGGVIAKSTDGGSSWTTPYPVIPVGGISQIAVDPINENRIYAAVRGAGVYIITNTLANGGSVLLRNEAHGLAKDQFGVVDIYSVVTDPNNQKIVYAGALRHNRGQSNGVFRSVDSGLTWTNISGNLGPQLNVNSLSVNPSNSFIYVDSYSGTWKLPPP